MASVSFGGGMAQQALRENRRHLKTAQAGAGGGRSGGVAGRRLLEYRRAALGRRHRWRNRGAKTAKPPGEESD